VNWRSGKSGVRPAPAASVLQTIVRPLAVIGLVILAAALLASSMTKEVSRDEHMYCTAGALLARGEMVYEDFSYPAQLPYHPLLLAALYRGLGTTHYLLVGRLVSTTCDILVIVLILLIYRSMFGPTRSEGMLFGLAAAVLYAFNPLVDYAAGYAWNHDVVILCVVLALWIFLTTDFRRPSRFWRVAVIGALLTFATCMRITTALIALLFLAALFGAAGGSFRNRSGTALPFSLAALVVLIWPLSVIARAPQAVRLNLVEIPALYGRWLHEIGMAYSKISLTLAALVTPSCLLLLALAGCLAWIMYRERSNLEKHERPKALLTALLPLVFLVIAYIPPTMWQQYLAVPVPFIVIAFAWPLAALRRHAETPNGRGRYKVIGYVVGAAAVLSIVIYPTTLYRSIFALVPERWTPVTLHKVSTEIAEKVTEPRLVLTLGPLYALEGGCDIYPEMAAGSIIYRVADRMSPEARRITKTVAPGSLDALLTERLPSAVITGIEPSYFTFLEDPLRQWVPPDWRRDTYQGQLQLYFRP